MTAGGQVAEHKQAMINDLPALYNEPTQSSATVTAHTSWQENPKIAKLLPAPDVNISDMFLCQGSTCSSIFTSILTLCHSHMPKADAFNK